MLKFSSVLLWLAASLAAQFPLVTPIPSSPTAAVPAVVGRGGHLWIAGRDTVSRVDQTGRMLFTARLEGPGAITAIATDRSGVVAVVKTEIDSTLGIFNADGGLLHTQKVAGAASAVQMDEQGNVYVAGRASEGFRGTAGAYKSEIGVQRCSTRGGIAFACSDAYLMKLRLDGTLLWATLLGGTNDDSAASIALDAAGSIWIAGETLSSDFGTTPGALQPSYGGGESLGPLLFGDAFLARIDAAGARLEYSTFLGGARFDKATTLTATAAGVLIAGSTESPNFPVTADAFQPKLIDGSESLPGSNTDAFIAFVSRAGKLVYSTYYGEARPQFALASASGPANEVGVTVAGTAKQCLLRLNVQETVGSFTRDCTGPQMQGRTTPAWSNSNWMAVGVSPGGLPVPGVDPAPVLTVATFGGDDGRGPVVVGAWNDYFASYRPIVAPDSFVTIYPDGNPDLTHASVRLGDHPLRILYEGANQINAYIPADFPIGTHTLSIDLPFYTWLPIAVDVAPRWPGLADAALNEDGTVNSLANPAARGSIVSLFGTGFGPSPLPVLEPYIQSSQPGGAQGMELLFAGRVAEGLFQVNVRIPQNVATGSVPARVVFRMEDGPLLSNLTKIFIR